MATPNQDSARGMWGGTMHEERSRSTSTWAPRAGDKGLRNSSTARDVVDGYECQFCNDLPYTLWNTCPLCWCGLLPVFVVCFSAIFRLDYATHVTDLGAELVNDMGLSYTVYYTAGCWPSKDGQQQHSVDDGLGGHSTTSSPHDIGYDRRQLDYRCSAEHFEVAAGEFDALSGSLLRSKNVTKVDAHRLDAVKVSPDWRYVVFAGVLDVPSSLETLGDSQQHAHNTIRTTNVWAVGAEESHARRGAELLTGAHVEALEEHCHDQARAAFMSADVETDGLESARLSGFRHLQIIQSPLEGPEGELQNSTDESPASWSPLYRLAFAFDCSCSIRRGADNHSKGDLVDFKFSKLAVVDFMLQRQNTSMPARKQDHQRSDGGQANSDQIDYLSKYVATSRLHIVDAEPSMQSANPTEKKAVAGFTSQSCPRFVPSKRGQKVLFVAEDMAAETDVAVLPSRLLALAAAPASTLRQDALSSDARRDDVSRRRNSAHVQRTIGDSMLLRLGANALPFAVVKGCPEFVPILGSSSTPPIADGERAEQVLSDTFIFESDPSSASVLGVAAQVIAVTLPGGRSLSPDVEHVRVLFNVDDAPAAFAQGGDKKLRLASCQPIRAAGRKGHMRLQWGFQKLMRAFNIKSEENGYKTWLACLTVDQHVAIVESPKQEHWINMSVPYPLWTGKPTQSVWCSPNNSEACFEVWSNPNPND